MRGRLTPAVAACLCFGVFITAVGASEDAGGGGDLVASQLSPLFDVDSPNHLQTLI